MQLIGEYWRELAVALLCLAVEVEPQIVLGTKASPNGYSTLLARNGSYIVHPDPVKLSHQTVFFQMEYGADYSVMEAAESM